MVENVEATSRGLLGMEYSPCERRARNIIMVGLTADFTPQITHHAYMLDLGTYL